MNALERQVLELIGEDPDSPDVFVDTDEGIAPIRSSISEGIAEVVMLTGCFKRNYFIPLREGQCFYRLRPNGDIGWITDAWLVNNKTRLEQTDLTRLSYLDPRWQKSSGTPEAYFQLGREVIGLYRKPSGNTDTLQLTFVEVPQAYTSEFDRIKLRDQFQYAVVNYAVADFWASRGDANEAQKHLSLYLGALGLAEEYMQSPQTPKAFWTAKNPAPVSP
jgi:hypothetical protein